MLSTASIGIVREARIYQSLLRSVVLPGQLVDPPPPPSRQGFTPPHTVTPVDRGFGVQHGVLVLVALGILMGAAAVVTNHTPPATQGRIVTRIQTTAVVTMTLGAMAESPSPSVIADTFPTPNGPKTLHTPPPTTNRPSPRPVEAILPPAQLTVAPAPLAAGSSSVPTEFPTPTYYTIVVGDSLGVVAARYGVSVAALIGINNLASAHLVLSGQRLLIPSTTYQPSSHALALAAARPPAPPAVSPPPTIQLQVKVVGDTLPKETASNQTGGGGSGVNPQSGPAGTQLTPQGGPGPWGNDWSDSIYQQSSKIPAP